MRETQVWDAELRKLPPDELIPGLPPVTGAQWVAFHGFRPPPEGVVFEEGVVYGHAGRDLLLHLYRPVDVSVRQPGVVFIHGGGWAGGHPFMHLRHAHELAALGYTTALVHYRLSLEAQWPAGLEDAKCAVRWMRANAASIGVDPGRIAISGGSAGGHLSCMVALTPGTFEGTGGHPDTSSEVQAAAVWYPMTDMSAPGREDEQIDAMLKGFLGSREEGVVREASPITYVRAGAPPILTMTGDLDPATTVGMIRDFHASLDRAGVENSLEVFEGRSHAFDFHPDDWERCFSLVTEWFAKYLG